MKKQAYFQQFTANFDKKPAYFEEKVGMNFHHCPICFEKLSETSEINP